MDELSEDHFINQINSSDADFLVAALGAKKGQQWLLRNHERLQVPLRAHLGATINFQAGTIKRAPYVVQKLGLEWLWRIKEEPHLFGRYWHDGGVLLRLLLTRVLPLAVSSRWRSFAPNVDMISSSSRSTTRARVTLHISGDATTEAVPAAIDAFREAIASHKPIEVDLSRTLTVDARFFGLLLMLRKHTERQRINPEFRRHLHGAGETVQTQWVRIFAVAWTTIKMSTLSIKKPLQSLSPYSACWRSRRCSSASLCSARRCWNSSIVGTNQEEYSHGFLIPVVTLFLLWSRRDATARKHRSAQHFRPALIALALAMHVVGELSAIWILSQVGFVLSLIGIVLAIGGYSLLRVCFIPIVYLLFAIPLPYFIDAVLTLKLQLISSQLGVLFIRLFQIPVFLDGNIIDMGTYKLQVVEACSGLRYLYPLAQFEFSCRLFV